MNHIVIGKLPSKEIAAGVVLRSAFLNNVMVTFVDLAAHSVVPRHSHPHEQISCVIKGRLRMKVGEEEAVLSPGEVMLVPSGMEHSAVALEEPVLAYDCWSPIRQDYIVDKKQTG